MEKEPPTHKSYRDRDSIADMMWSSSSVKEAGANEHKTPKPSASAAFPSSSSSFGIKTTSLTIIAVVLMCLGALYQDDKFQDTINYFPISIKSSKNEAAETADKKSMVNKGVDDDWFNLRVAALMEERNQAANTFLNRTGRLWFFHNQKAGGTSLCQLIQPSFNKALVKSCFLEPKCFHPWLSCPEKGENNSLKERNRLNSTASFPSVQSRVGFVESRMKSNRNRLVTSELSFIPRSVLREWIVKGNPEYVKLFESWSFVLNLRHPVKRLESAFYFHSHRFKLCRKLTLDQCLWNTTYFSRGRHRNKLVKELSGFFAPTDFKGVEATREDLQVAKLILARFLPPIVYDTPEQLSETLHTTFSTYLNVSLPDPSSITAQKGKATKDPMTKAAETWIKAHNELDMELYEYALRLAQRETLAH